MNFLKENLFMVITAAVVVVCGSAMVLLGKSMTGQYDTNSKLFISRANDINSLASNGVNDLVVEAAKRRVEDMRYQAETVADTSLWRNRRGYEVLSFEISGRTVLAFPVDPDEDRETLQQLFPGKYRAEIKRLFETLKPTVPPTVKEINDEIARITASAIPAEKEGTVKHTGTVRGGYDSGASSRHGEDRRDRDRHDRDRHDRDRHDRDRRDGDKGRPSMVADVKSAIGRQALINLVVRQSEKGWIYADEEQDQTGDGRSATNGAMHVALIKRDTLDYSDDDLWMAQVGLWVQKDIIKAINLTNEQVRKTASGKQTGVAASAVKRLMNINVRGFVLGGTAGLGAASATLRYVGADSTKSSKAPPQLTGRACNKLYDVVHYELTVVIPMRHLLRLQRNLMAQNYHTILEIGIIRPVQSDVHYYGADSVMKVTIVGEMLMLTDWTRGRWDKEANDWDKDYPHLMPVKDFLNKIQAANPDAIRDEDKKRKGLSEAIGKDTPRKQRDRRPEDRGRRSS